MRLSLIVLALFLASALLAAQTSTGVGSPLARHYREGETLTYQMTAVNDTWHYTADATGIVKKNADGSYVEEFRWSRLTSDGRPVAPVLSIDTFRMQLSLDPGWTPSGRDLAKVDPRLVGPSLDLMTFYVALWIANKVGVLQHASDHFYVPNPQPSSWADGTRVLTGQDHIDFDLDLHSIDPVKKTAQVLVHHVPPPHPNLQFPAGWMQTPVADTPNNWVEVSKTKDGKYQAGAGKETLDVLITVSTVDGKILCAKMDNPVVMSGRLCDDAALTQCGGAESHTIHRHIEIALAP